MPAVRALHAVDTAQLAHAAVATPKGQRLAVRDMPGAAHGAQSQPEMAQQAGTPLPAGASPQAAKIEAVPVLEPPDSRRDEPPGLVAASVPASPEGDFWYATVQALIASEAINAMVRELALQSQLVARDSDQWLLRVERESLNQSGNRERLAAALAAAGYPVRLVAEVGRVTDSPARRNASAAAQAQLAAEKIVFDDPLVQSLMRDFGAKIVPGSIKPA